MVWVMSGTPSYCIFSLIVILGFISFIYAQGGCVLHQVTDNSWCGCGPGRLALGPCVGGECPDGYTCVCDYCCEGCFDDCYDCALFAQYCENSNYCELRQKCKRTCGLCADADNGDEDDG